MIRILPASLALRLALALLVAAGTSPVSVWGDDQTPTQDELSAAKSLVRWLTTGTTSAHDSRFPATHRQTRTLQVFQVDERDQRVASFCRDSQGRLLIAVQSDPGEIRVLSTEGERLASWPLPIRPEAINPGPDGSVLVAGAGRILHLDRDGSILRNQPAPQVVAFQDNRESLRAEVIANLKSAARSYQRMLTQFEDQVDRLLMNAMEPDERQECVLLRKRLTSLEKQPKDERNWFEKRAIRQRRQLVEQLIAQAEQRLDAASRQRLTMLREQIKTYRQSLEDSGADAPNEQQIESAMESTRAYKSRASSISYANGDVFLATGAVKGYGYDIWRLDSDLAHAEKIVTGLRGCCGQMDVRASTDGIFVAENSRHRVCQFDREGNRIRQWGRRDTRGVQGFGSCCNPMNVAFGPDGSIYTAESTTGRIKKYQPDGELVALVGSVELVPGCKNVAIDVSGDGSQVYMLDITRNQINVMEEISKSTSPPGDHEQAAESASDTDEVTARADN